MIGTQLDLTRLSPWPEQSKGRLTVAADSERAAIEAVILAYLEGMI